MKDIEILKQLLNGNHLEINELERAKQIIHSLNLSLNERLKQN